MRHLVRLGHRRIAIVVEERTCLSAADVVRARLPPDGGMTSPLREAGWAAALREAGLPVTDDLICGARYERADARRATAVALALADRPTAIVTTDETMTLGAIDAIHDAGLRVPDDISLIAFDDLPWTELIRPPLTVVAQPVRDLGATATQRLLGRIAGNMGPPETVILSTSFVVRGSTGPVPGLPPMSVTLTSCDVCHTSWSVLPLADANGQRVLLDAIQEIEPGTPGACEVARSADPQPGGRAA